MTEKPRIPPARHAGLAQLRTMKDQTIDNLRCLAAVVCLLVITFSEIVVQSIWFPSWPGWIPVVLFVVLIPVALYIFNSRRSVRIDRVTFDDVSVTRNLLDGKTETVRWDDLKEVGIVTTDEGPAQEDVYWILLGSAGGCAVSGSAEGIKELLARFQQLPGFDNEAVIKAMGSTSNNKFLCWKRGEEDKK